MLISRLSEIYGKSTSCFSVSKKRTMGLKFVASSARIFFGRGAVMAKALGTTPEEEHRLGLSKLSTVREQNLFPSPLQL